MGYQPPAPKQDTPFNGIIAVSSRSLSFSLCKPCLCLHPGFCVSQLRLSGAVVSPSSRNRRARCGFVLRAAADKKAALTWSTIRFYFAVSQSKLKSVFVVTLGVLTGYFHASIMKVSILCVHQVYCTQQLCGTFLSQTLMLPNSFDMTLLLYLIANSWFTFTTEFRMKLGFRAD